MSRGPETDPKPTLHAHVAYFLFSVIRLATEGVFCLSLLFGLTDKKCLVTFSSA
jgi:hypothetical protein